MHAAALVCHLEKTFDVGGFQFSDLAVVQNIVDDGVVLSELFQHLSARGVARLGLFVGGKHQGFKQNLTKLLGRVDVERLSRVQENAVFQIGGHGVQHLPVSLDGSAVNLESERLHIAEHGGQRHFDLTEHGGLFGLLQLSEENIAEGRDRGELAVSIGGCATEEGHAETIHIKAAHTRIESVRSEHDVHVHRTEADTVGIQIVVELLSIMANKAVSVGVEECIHGVAGVVVYGDATDLAATTNRQRIPLQRQRVAICTESGKLGGGDITRGDGRGLLAFFGDRYLVGGRRLVR